MQVDGAALRRQQPQMLLGTNVLVAMVTSSTILDIALRIVGKGYFDSLESIDYLYVRP